ncbi:MAG: ribbon-helix-helix domain-containing protein [Bacteroidota bacterium]|nr:ribbon-helix-helix domain-containing protein [Bacteroidota bacterium]
MLKLDELAKRRRFKSRSAFVRHILTEYILADAVQVNHMSQQTNELTLLEVIERNNTVLELICEELLGNA